MLSVEHIGSQYGPANRATGSIAAISPTATTMSMPGIVISRLTFGSPRASRASSRSTTFRSSLRRSYSRRCRARALLSSGGSGWARSQALPRSPNRSAWGHGGTRWVCRIDCTIVFSRARCRTIWVRRVTCRRKPSVASSGIHNSGRTGAGVGVGRHHCARSRTHRAQRASVGLPLNRERRSHSQERLTFVNREARQPIEDKAVFLRVDAFHDRSEYASNLSQQFALGHRR